MSGRLSVLDLFSAAAGGWSLGMHRAGYRTVAACEAVWWRRVLYSENNPGVPVYDDVCTLTAERLLADLGFLPRIVVGSPPCQDISSANTKGKGVEGERSGLFFEAVRLIGEIRPRWFALENSANLRTRGADAVLAALEALGYACWTVVVRARDCGANHERPRSWIIGCDLDQLADANGLGWDEGRRGRLVGVNVSHAAHPDSAPNSNRDAIRLAELPIGPEPETAQPEYAAGNAAQDGCGQRRSWGRSLAASGVSVETCRDSGAAVADPDQAGQADGCMVPSIRQEEIARLGRRDVGRDDVSHTDEDGEYAGTVDGEMGERANSGCASSEPWADWNGGLSGHLRVDDGLSTWLASQRVAVGGPRGTTAASLIVEAFGDAVVPQIPEAIGRAILRVEEALAAVYSQEAA